MLLAFGDLARPDGTVDRSERIADALLGEGLWFTTLNPRALTGTPTLFYRNGHGIIGHAKVREITTATPRDVSVALGYQAPFLRYTLHLSNVQRAAKPLALGDLVDSLTFVSNKKYWGGSFRRTPRRIPMPDYDTIIAAGKRAGTW
jgi:hypothetical protein